MNKDIKIEIKGTKVIASFGKMSVTINSYDNIDMNRAEAIFILNKNIRNDK